MNDATELGDINGISGKTRDYEELLLRLTAEVKLVVSGSIVREQAIGRKMKHLVR